MLLESAPDRVLNARWRDAIDSHKAHAHAEWPREACGVVRTDGSYLAVPNVAKDPVGSFKMPDGVFRDETPLAVLHSHTSEILPDGSEAPPQDSPSELDMICQADTAVPWGITLVLQTGAADPFWFGDEVPRRPLLERPFRHGVNDCYALIRDWHAEVPGIMIPEFPRDPDWWTPDAEGNLPDKDMYLEGFAAAGFVKSDRDAGSILPGDVFICKLLSERHNHGGVYIGDGLLIHHLAHRLSQREPASMWRQKLNFLVRHKDLPEDWKP